MCVINSCLLCRLKNQIPQITQTLQILQHMQKKKVCTLLELEVVDWKTFCICSVDVDLQTGNIYVLCCIFQGRCFGIF